MDITHSLRMRQQQKLVMTPQLQQVIRLLQVPTVELVDLVRKELEQNPTLEEAGEDEPLPEQLSGEAPREDEIEREMDSYLEMAEERGPSEGRDRDREERLERLQERRLVEATNLQDHLLEQVNLSDAAAGTRALAEGIIGNLDGNGYLTVPLGELADSLKAGEEKLAKALKLVQSLDPAGVGARDLRECLLIQLRGTEEDTKLARRLVEHHLDRLDHSRPGLAAELAKETGEAAEKVEAALKQVRHCDPKPGSRYAPPAPRVTPDARIEKSARDFVVTLNDDGVPPLRLSQSYREMLAKRDQLSGEDRKYLQEHFRSALMLMRGLVQRRVTMYRVLEHLVKTQREFLERGLGALRPLTLREVAADIGVHESTVSRVVANKYVETPRGLYALKDFFSTRLPAGAGSASGAAVRERIRELIDAEDPANPLADEKLAEMLAAEGISIARRTVTKYREGMKMPGAWQRKGRKKD